MATNPPGPRKAKYCPVENAPPPAKLRQRDNQQATPQLLTQPYRKNMTPGRSPTNAKLGGRADGRRGDGS